ncbi:MAG: hypothetical protein R3Y28_00345 [Candidatus Gastranaerophilales bacterium]
MNNLLKDNFNEALSFYEFNHSYYELINFLKVGNDVEKQMSALKLEYVNSIDDAKSLCANLVDNDGKIREIVSFKLKEFVQMPRLVSFFHDYIIYDILLKAVVDINGNVCRNVIMAIDILRSNIEFCDYFIPRLVVQAIDLSNVVSEFDLQDGKYKTNKETFKLYWVLATIEKLCYNVSKQDLLKVLTKAKSVQDYTIREKVAKILVCVDGDFDLIRKDLLNDENHFVRRHLRRYVNNC